MTNTKFRKRALLSAVAMLLVALVALGSATFAWFTSLPTANAQGLQMKATAAQGLVVLSGSAITEASKPKATASSWVHDEFLNCNSGRTASKTDSLSIDAASCSQAATPAFFTTNAKLDTVATADPDAEVTAATVGTPGVYHEELWTKITGSNTDANIKMTSLVINRAGSSDHALLTAFRVALYYTNADGVQTFIGEYATSAKSNEVHITGLGTPGTGGKTYYNKTGVASPNVNCVKANKNVSVAPSSDVAIGSCDGTGNCKFDIYCYLDGEDGACFTNNVDASDVVSSIQVNLAIVE
ncbi:hypothetical protein [Ruminococcus sp.]|uniref:hypothetical protein n=1 Tax=Ruminococcus sp. TaxID=41978 RepID=UPI0038704090